MHLLPGQAVIYVPVRVVTLLSLNMWWRLRDWASAALFCHAEDVWRTTRKCVPLADHQFLNHADVSALVTADKRW